MGLPRYLIAILILTGIVAGDGAAARPGDRLTPPEQWRRQWAAVDRQLAALPGLPDGEVVREVGGRVAGDGRLSASVILDITPRPPRPLGPILADYERALRGSGWAVRPADDEYGEGYAFAKDGFAGRVTPAGADAPGRAPAGFRLILSAPPEPLAPSAPARPPDAAMLAAATAPMTLQEATARAGFALLWPGAPPPGATYAGAAVGRLATPAERGATVAATWSGAPRPALEPLLSLHQRRVGPSLPGGEATTVRGRPAQLADTPFTYPEADGRTGAGREVMLWWEEGDTRVVLRSRALSADALRRVAEGLAIRQPASRAAYREATVQGREGPYMVAGPVEAFAQPSVTRLTDAGLYLLRSDAGFLALVDEDPHMGHPTGWDATDQLFRSPAHGETYDWRGLCIAGPCPRGLDRHPVVIRDGLVMIDAGSRIRGPASRTSPATPGDGRPTAPLAPPLPMTPPP